jgi:hypothetical protein
MIKGIVPCSGIDIDARWDQSVIPGSGTVGYKLHTAANTGSQADIQDSQCTRNNISTSARSMLHGS